jgi:hypothetical protein
MRAFAIAVVAVLGLCLAIRADAADLGGKSWHGGRSHVSSAYDDGPYYVTPRGNSSYVECGRPSVPYPDNASPEPNSQFFGPVGYRCVLGTYAYEPFYPPRCVTAFFKTSHGWKRERRCF